MRYLLAFNYFLMKPKTGWKNALSVGVCLLIPFVGQMVALGYRSFVIEDLDDDPDKRYHRDFQFGKFGDYLTRGLWQGLIQIAVQMVLIGGMYAVMIGVMLTGALGNNPAAAVIFFAVAMVFFIALSVVVAMFLWPVEVYASLRPEFEFGAAVAFARTFVAAMWRECLAAILAFAILSMTAGLLLVSIIIVVAGGVGFGLGYGVHPVAGIIVGVLLYMLIGFGGGLMLQAVLIMANGHLLAQLYVVYLQKGGQPLRDRDPFEPDPLLPAEDLD